MIIVSSCGEGRGLAERRVRLVEVHEEERPRAYQDFPRCGPDFTRRDYDDEADPLLRGLDPADGYGVVGGAAST